MESKKRFEGLGLYYGPDWFDVTSLNLPDQIRIGKAAQEYQRYRKEGQPVGEEIPAGRPPREEEK